MYISIEHNFNSLFYRKETSSFSIWLNKSFHILEDNESLLSSLSSLNKLPNNSEACKDFVNDIIAHQADLRFITMAAQKFADESKEYLQLLNDLRNTLPQRFSSIEPIPIHESAVQNEVSSVTSQYKELLARATTLSEKFTVLVSLHYNYSETLDKVSNWLQDLEPRIQRVLTTISEPKQIEVQFSSAKLLYAEALANERLIIAMKQSFFDLMSCIDNYLALNERQQLERPVQTLEERYRQMSETLAERCHELDAALLQSQSMQDAIEGLLIWLNTAEAQFKNICRPASLQRERLKEQRQEQRLLQVELESHRVSVEALTTTGQQTLPNHSFASLTIKEVELKLGDIQSRYEKLLERSERRAEFLDGVTLDLDKFYSDSSSLESWNCQTINLLSSREFVNLSLSEYETKIIQIRAQQEDQRPLLENVVRLGKTLIVKKDVSESSLIRDKIKVTESQWKELNNLLEEKQRSHKIRIEKLAAYEKLRDQLLDWLDRTENKVLQLQPVSVDLEKIKQQLEELKPLQKEFKDYGNTIEKLNNLGIAYDNITKESSDYLTIRRGGSTSPSKRPTVSSPRTFSYFFIIFLESIIRY